MKIMVVEITIRTLITKRYGTKGLCSPKKILKHSSKRDSFILVNFSFEVLIKSRYQ